MTSLRESWARLIAFFRKREIDRDFDEELRAHIELATQDYIRQGMSAVEARRMARIKLGGVEQSKELHRDSRGLPWLDGVAQDVRFAFRSLGRSPCFTLTAVLMLVSPKKDSFRDCEGSGIDPDSQRKRFTCGFAHVHARNFRIDRIRRTRLLDSRTRAMRVDPLVALRNE